VTRKRGGIWCPTRSGKSLEPDHEILELEAQRDKLKNGHYRIRGTEHEDEVRQLTKAIRTKKAQREKRVREEYRKEGTVPPFYRRRGNVCGREDVCLLSASGDERSFRSRTPRHDGTEGTRALHRLHPPQVQRSGRQAAHSRSLPEPRGHGTRCCSNGELGFRAWSRWYASVVGQPTRMNCLARISVSR